MDRAEPTSRPIVLVMVGKPARGKTYTARKIARYLAWLGYRTRVFNVGNYRRERLGARQDHSFFDPSNDAGVKARHKLAIAALEDMTFWLDTGGEVAIFDATNTTHTRRARVKNHCEDAGYPVMFVELVNDDPTLIESNIRQTKILSPDYAGMDPDRAVDDFRQRIQHYDRAYEPLGEDVSYVRLIDVGRRVEVNQIRGYLPSRVVVFLMNLHITPRPIYLTRHGESLFNLEGRIGGDAGLAPTGATYARSLGVFMTEAVPPDQPLSVWTSTLRRTRETAAHLGRKTTPWRVLNEIGAGICDGLTYEEVAEKYPKEFAARTRDKFRYRYPRGESYEDVIARLEPAIIEAERQRDPVLIIGHQAVLRALYAYFVDLDPTGCAHLKMPLHTVLKLTPRAYGCDVERFPLDPRPASPSVAGV